jgi:ElaB/YqjD/DUF883 family membrane-anchored ribosome-binding protein
MDEATREGRPPVTAGPDDTPSEQKGPEELRQDIEQTRDELGDTVEALAEKTDVKAQAKDRIAAVKSTTQEKKDEFITKAKGATPDSASAGVQQVTSTVQRKPLPFTAVAAFAAGVLVGRLKGRR